MVDRPSKIISVDDLNSFYWLKTDLLNFCKHHKLPLQGSKLELTQRVKIYLTTGDTQQPQSIEKSNNQKDSAKPITKNTLVKNYNNDAETRKFFVEQLGKNFKFNAYLRQFTNQKNITQNMTYGELVDGYTLFENGRKNSKNNHVIPEQFEYNKFIRDYFHFEKHATLKMAIKAWKFVTSKNGPNTYEYFNALKNKEDT